MKTLPVVFAAMLALPMPQTTPQQPPNCTGAEHRQFDFWIGTWTVSTNGKPAGTNRIESGHQGCVLVENWTAQGGGTGISLNFYDRQTHQWHQTWMGSGGGALYLNGGLREGAMVMQSAALPQPGGGSLLHRITWSPLAGGNVRQHWESSTDGGKSWTTAFDGLYRRAAS